GPDESEVELDRVPVTPIPVDSKVAIVTPFFGGLSLSINLSANPKGVSLTPEDKAFLTAVEADLKEGGLAAAIPLAGGGTEAVGNWDVGVQKGYLDAKGEPVPLSATDDQGRSRSPTPLTSVFYLVTPDSNAPLFHYWVKAGKDGAVQDLVGAIEKRA